MSKNYYVQDGFKEGTLREGYYLGFETPDEAWEDYILSKNKEMDIKRERRDKLIEEIYSLNNKVIKARAELVKLKKY